MHKHTITIFTDGSSLGNPGPGGWAAVIIFPKEKKVRELGGYERDTTNNRMELMAAIEALMHLRSEEGAVEIHTDSAYVLHGITKWVHEWAARGWITAARESVQNQDMWQALMELAIERKNEKGGLVWKKTTGHAGIHGNERADAIATSFAENKLVLLFDGTLSDYEKMLGASAAEIRKAAPAEYAKKRKSKKTKTGAGYSYVSYVKGRIHVDKTWADCEKRVKGKRGTRYKKAMNKQEENELVALYSLESLK